MGVGAIISTKFTWPRRSEPKDLSADTASAKRTGASWIALYNERICRSGIYRGELYDIGFDKPETHVVEKGGRLYSRITP